MNSKDVIEMLRSQVKALKKENQECLKTIAEQQAKIIKLQKP